MKQCILILSCLCTLTLGCSANDDSTGDMDPDSSLDDMGNNGNNGASDLGDDSSMPPESGWTAYEHPCEGNRTDALWCDDLQTCFVGCGTTTTGTGLFTTTDGGVSWNPITTTPADRFADTRINTIYRGSNGLLYAGGELWNKSAVASVNSAGEIEDVFVRGTTFDTSFLVGSFRRSEGGLAIAESLNGAELVQREADGDATTSWNSGRGFWSDGDSDDIAAGVQILDMEILGEDFWGVGSTINQPPSIFTPKWAAGDFDFGIVQLTTDFTGELWGIDVHENGVVAGGVNQTAAKGLIYTLPSGADATSPTSWQLFDVGTLFPDNSTWVTDVCRGATAIYAVGRESRKGWGFALMSTDEGVTFQDITPYDSEGKSEFPDLSRCQVLGTDLLVAGAAGQFAKFSPAIP